jgi:hypothetical protein
MNLWKRLDRYLRTLRAHKRLDRRIAELIADRERRAAMPNYAAFWA